MDAVIDMQNAKMFQNNGQNFFVTPRESVHSALQMIRDAENRSPNITNGKLNGLNHNNDEQISQHQSSN